ncbi:MAG: MotA/TolQ/ExbB proton channel family protein [Nitrospirota bacterium]
MEWLTTVQKFFIDGGAFMYPILLVMAVGTAIVIERFLVLFRAQTDGHQLWSKIRAALMGQKLDEAIRLCRASNAPLPQLLLVGLTQLKSQAPRPQMEGSLQEFVLEVVPNLERRTGYLPILANVATLLGLLGTIIGLIRSFQSIAVADPSQKAALIAQGISVAMNTTAFGLIVAIPLLLAYSFLQSRTLRIEDSLDEFSTKLLNAAEQSRGAVAAPKAVHA